VLALRTLALFSVLAMPDARARPEGGRSNMEEVAALRARIAREAMRNRYLADETRSLEAALIDTETAIAERRTAAERLRAQRRDAEARRAEAEARLADVRAELAALRREAGRRAAAMRRTSRLGPEAFWLGIEDPVRARRTEDRLRFVLEHDAALARAIRHKAREETEQIERLAAEVERLRVARARARAEADELAGLRAAREVLLEALRRERRRSDRIAGLLDRARREGARAARFEGGNTPAPAPAPGGFEAQRGLLPWPTEGRVEVTFGAKVHPAGVIVRQTGLDIRADLGRPVTAVFDGWVVHAARRPGWGRLVVVAHSGGWHTVYGHLDRFVVETGASVRRGQHIGAVGASDSDKGPFLYFEIRRADEPVDPLRWLHR
jgi:septal ring factor EnvC (AmiA/AmiB activator)